MNFRYALEDAWRFVPGAQTIVQHSLWDLTLGAVAVLLGWLFTGSLYWRSGWRRGVCWLLALLWISFLPNAAYLIVTVRSIPDVTYFIFDASAHNVIDGSRRTTASLLWIFFYMGVALGGVGLYGAAIYPVQRRCVKDSRSGLLLCMLISFAAAVGVELGLSHRYNTWDLVTHPAAILWSAVRRLTDPTVETFFVVVLTLLLVGLWYLTWIFGAGLMNIEVRRTREPNVSATAAADCVS